MSKGFSSNDTLNKFLTFSGIAIIAGTLYWSWGWSTRFEAEISPIYEALITTSVELQSLENKARNLDLASKGIVNPQPSSNGSSKVIKYSDFEIQQLMRDSKIVRDQLIEKSAQANAIIKKKNQVIRDVKIIYWGSLVLLLAGVMIAAFGALCWYYNIKIVKDRRDKPRAEDSTETV